MAPDAQPIIRRRERQVNVLGGFQLDDRQPPASRDGQQIENAVFTAGVCEYLCVDTKPVSN